MNNISIKDLIDIDQLLISEGSLLYQRPFHAAIKWSEMNNKPVDLLSPDFFEDQLIPFREMYTKLYPNESFDFPNLLLGSIAIRDIVYPVKVPILYGQHTIDPLDLIVIDSNELKRVFSLYPEEGWQAIYSVCDLIDFGFGADDLIKTGSPAKKLLERALEQTNATSNILQDRYSIQAVAQTALLTTELAFKATFLHLGYSESKCKKFSHNHLKMAEFLIEAIPSKNDEEIIQVCRNLPSYVQSRYDDVNLNRVELIKIAMSSQFIAAECMRRISTRNIIQVVEQQANFPRSYKF